MKKRGENDRKVNIFIPTKEDKKRGENDRQVNIFFPGRGNKKVKADSKREKKDGPVIFSR